MERPSFRYIFTIFLAISLLLLIATFSTNTQVSLKDGIKMQFKRHREPLRQPISSKRWIVVTSVNQPTDDVKRLVALPGWSVVIVGDTKTPANWSLHGAHFLSVEDQKQLDLELPSLLPFKSYTRKNVGYLFAIKNGAEWIYDTDDDNKPYGLGPDQFDYMPTISGLRYQSKANASTSDRLFNPYRFFGHQDMWPRGFPLEYISNHTNGEDRLLLCREMTTPSVQQGIVHKDPDVDAIYRLLRADSEKGLTERFNQFAPPITLDRGTYAPWNSQNTLFNRRAFFTMFLPTTVEFRVTDIWRSYFSQKLLHLIGDTIGFYPVNAIQIRNAHKYLADFEDEKAVYLKSGTIVTFLQHWKCTSKTTELCTIELAEEFKNHKFIEAADFSLIQAWVRDLKAIGYQFPPLVVDPFIYKDNSEDRVAGNCRAANLQLITDLTTNYSEPQTLRSVAKANGFGELLEWCSLAEIGRNISEPHDLILSPETISVNQAGNKNLTDKLDSVLVITNNYPFNNSIGLLQRMYEPYFATIVFCGTWYPEKYQEDGFSKMRKPFNFINLTQEEMHAGWYAYYCISKIRDMRLQNVKGYYFASDDAVFNFWNGNNMNLVGHPQGIHDNVKPNSWWNMECGSVSAFRSVALVEGIYANNSRIQATWKELERRLKANGYNTTASDHVMQYNGNCVSDFFYIPKSELEFFADMSEIFREGGLFHELVLNKMMYATKGLEILSNHAYLWADRLLWPKLYNSSIIMIHPIKFRIFGYNGGPRYDFCSTVIETHRQKLYM